MDKNFKDIHIIDKRTKEEITVFRQVHEIHIQDAEIIGVLMDRTIIQIPLIDVSKIKILID